MYCSEQWALLRVSPATQAGTRVLDGTMISRTVVDVLLVNVVEVAGAVDVIGMGIAKFWKRELNCQKMIFISYSKPLWMFCFLLRVICLVFSFARIFLNVIWVCVLGDSKVTVTSVGCCDRVSRVVTCQYLFEALSIWQQLIWNFVDSRSCSTSMPRFIE